MFLIFIISANNGQVVLQPRNRCVECHRKAVFDHDSGIVFQLPRFAGEYLHISQYIGYRCALITKYDNRRGIRTLVLDRPVRRSDRVLIYDF